MNPTPNEQNAMKEETEVMSLVETFGQSCKLAGVLEAKGKDRTEANSAIFSTADAIRAAIRKLVSRPPTAGEDRFLHRAVKDSATLVALGKLVSSALPAQSQDAQPVAWLWTNPDGSKECSFVKPEDDPDLSTILALELGRVPTPLYASPTIPQAGLIEAADKHADDYEGQDIPARDVRAAITNAFYAGARFRSLPQEEAAAQMQQWQPIETAPKDGTQILLGRVADLDEDGEPRPGVVAQGYWIEGYDDAPDQMGHDDCWTDCNFDAFSYPRSMGAEAYKTKGYQPTHWMPLPPPPLHRSEQSTDKEQG